MTDITSNCEPRENLNALLLLLRTTYVTAGT